MSAARDVPLVSVVVPVFDVVDFLAEALDSVLAQEGVELDVVVVDDASTDGSDAVAQRYADTDPRVRLVRQDHAGLGAARNTGVRHTRGELLTFHDSDDVVPPGSYAAMADSLRASGSDFCIGRLERFDSTRRWTPEWSREVHEHAPHQHVTIDELPRAMKNIIACNRMYRRAFWDERVGSFPEGTAYEDHLPMLRSFLDGARFDVLATTTYLWRRREDGTSISQQKADLQNLADRLAAKESAWELVGAGSSPSARSAYASRVLDLDLSGFYPHAPHASPEYREAFAAAAARWLDRADDGSLRTVRHHRKVAAWLAAHEHWTALDWLENAGGKRTLGDAAVEVDGALRAVADPLVAATGLEVPGKLLALAEDQLVLEPALVRTRWADAALELDLDVELRGARSVPAPTAVTLRIGEATLGAEPRVAAAGPEPGAWRARVDLAPFLEAAHGGADRTGVTVHVRWTADEEHPSTQQAAFATVARGSGAAHRRARLAVHGDHEHLVTPAFRPERGLELLVEPVPVRIRELGFASGAPRVVLTASEAPDAAGLRVTARSGEGKPVTAETSPSEGGGVAARLALPAPVADGEPWVLRARLADGTVAPALWPAGQTEPVVPADATSPWRWEPTARARCSLVARTPLAEVHAVSVVGDAVQLEVALVDPWHVSAWRVRWAVEGERVRATRRGTRWAVVVPVRLLEGNPVTLGAVSAGRDVTVRVARDVLDALPLALPGGVLVTAGKDAQARLQRRD